MTMMSLNYDDHDDDHVVRTSLMTMMDLYSNDHDELEL